MRWKKLIKYISLDITLTRKCNLNCKYCEGHSDTDDNTPLVHLSEIKNVVEKISVEYPDNKINFMLLGGELTTLPKNYLLNVVTYLKKLKNCGHIHVFTNAKEYSPEIKECIKNFNNVFLGVSFDTTSCLLNMRNINKEEIINTLKQYDCWDKIAIHSTFNNFTISTFKKLQEFFISYGVRKFKFKFERNDAFLIENYTNSKYKFINILYENLLDDVEYIDNFTLETVVVMYVGQYMELAIHHSKHNDRMNRNVFGKIPFDKKLFNIYE